jgi:SAM-dependent methyltransferase
MSASNLIENIERLDYEYQILKLSDSEKTMLDVESYEKFRKSLYDILEVRKELLYEKSSNLSQHMSVGQPKFTVEHVMKFNERIRFNEENENVLVLAINKIIGNDMPVLELFPGNGQFTTKLIAGDPFYIADYFQENLDKVGSQFNDFYNTKRLMKLKINDFELPLPDNQIGLVVSFKFFFVKDLDFIVNWANEVFRILRPSGTFIFNFIPDNTSQGIQMAEQNLITMVNCQQLKKELEKIGYDIIKISINNNFGTHITAQKLGNFNKIKLSPSLARIIDKSEPLV